MSSKSRHAETLALHAGWRADPNTGSVAVPIYQTTSYQFDDTGHAAEPVRAERAGQHLHPDHEPHQRCARDSASPRWRAASPRWRWPRARRLGLRGARTSPAPATTSSASTDLYGGTWNLFANTLKDLGIEVRFVDPADPEAFRRATDDRTRAYYAEDLPNPKLRVFPIAEVAAIGREFGIPLIVDNTAAPLLVRPFDHGAAVVVYSTTKYIGGHGTSIGGLIVDGGNFDWEAIPSASRR